MEKTFINFRAAPATREKLDQIAANTNHKTSWIARRLVESQLEKMNTENPEAARELVAQISVSA